MALFCYIVALTAVKKSINIDISTPHCAKKLRTMQHSAEFLKKFYMRLRAMQLSVKFKPKNFLSTSRYAA
jgi:hypothetical protein